MIRLANIGITDLLFQLGAQFEAAPYYEGIRIKMAVEGTRTKTVAGIVTTQEFDYQIEETFSRVPLEVGSVISGADGGLGGIDDYSSFDAGSPLTPAGSTCNIEITGDAFDVRLSPCFQSMAFRFRNFGPRPDVEIGTYTRDGQEQPLLGPEWAPAPPVFFNSLTPPAGQRILTDRWGTQVFPVYTGLDSSTLGYAASQEAFVPAPESFRDLRGIQTITIADPETAGWDSSSVSYTYEWEII